MPPGNFRRERIRPWPAIFFCLLFLVAVSGPALAEEDTDLLRYAHSELNVRQGPGLRFEVIDRLDRGDAVRIGRVQKGWGEIVCGEREGCGYVLLRLLKEEPFRPLEVLRWDWRPAPEIGRRGVVVWVAELRNNATRASGPVRVEFRTFDKEGSVLDSDQIYFREIEPGKVAGSRSFATFSGKEVEGELRVLSEEGEVWSSRK